MDRVGRRPGSHNLTRVHEKCYRRTRLCSVPARSTPLFADIADISRRLAETGYLPDTATATVVFLADRLVKPLLVEGPAGVGKTELARAVAQATGSGLVRLQCYEGVDEARALYEWNHAKQILRIQAGSGDVRPVVPRGDGYARRRRRRRGRSGTGQRRPARRRRRRDAADVAGPAHPERRPGRHGRTTRRDDRADRRGLRQIQL